MTNFSKIPVVPILLNASKVRVFRSAPEAAAAIFAVASKKLPDQIWGRLFLLQQNSAIIRSLPLVPNAGELPLKARINDAVREKT
jgi:hypothetical protein